MESSTADVENSTSGRARAAPDQQQQPRPVTPSSASSPSSRERQRQETTTTTRRRRRRNIFYFLLSSALTLALSSLYFSTTVATTRAVKQVDDSSTIMNVFPSSNTRTTTTTKAQPDISIAAPKPEVVGGGGAVSESKTIDEETFDKNPSQRNGAGDGDKNEPRRPKAAAAGGDGNVVVDNRLVFAKQLLEHPYWGARDEHGQGGHVHDPTVHRRPFTISTDDRLAGLCNDAPGTRRKKGSVPGRSTSSIEGGEMGARALEKVQIAASSSDNNKKKNDDDDDDKTNNPPIRLFCAVYTHTGAMEQTDALLETWAPRCDGLLLASNATNATTHHVHIPHKSVAEGKYKGIWQRVRAMMAYLYQNFLNDYDYFHFCGDDTYVLVENLKAFLTSAQVANATNHGERPLFAGYWAHLKFWGDEYPEDFYFLSGGPGYTLSRSALKVFVEEALPTCRAKKDDPFEDLNVAWCLYHMLNISGIDTRDETGAQRYHPMSAEMHAKFPAQKTYGPPSFMVRKTKEHMEKEFGFPILYGLDDISTSSVAFHYLKTPVELRRYEMLLYGTGREQCNNSDRTSAVAVA